MTTVGEPALSEPALSDEATAQLYALAARQARMRVFAGTLALLFVAAVLWVMFAVPEDSFYGRLISGAPLIAFAGAVMLWQARTPPVAGGLTWRPATSKLLAGQPWRETPAKVLNTRGTVLVFPGGEYVRVTRLPAVVREVVVRAGRVWTVGPDAAGNLAVRVDGLHTAWPARRIPPRPGTAALPAGDVIADMWLRFFVERFRAATVASVLGTSLFLLGVAGSGMWWSLPTMAAYMICAAGCWVRFLYLARLRPSGPWTRAEAVDVSWRVRRNGLADGTATLVLPDGRGFTAQLDRAPLDLFATMAREKSLWVAGSQVVGFPHYPIVASARFAPVHA